MPTTAIFFIEEWPKSGTPGPNPAIIGYTCFSQSAAPSWRHLIGRRPPLPGPDPIPTGGTRSYSRLPENGWAIRPTDHQQTTLTNTRHQHPALEFRRFRRRAEVDLTRLTRRNSLSFEVDLAPARRSRSSTHQVSRG
ncbi:unnamed protein product [Ectocarpus sp. CCAP 1310/34]|nr:unnamed protein product [Ectocarpus sp. CCAP 1310/34]